jgi:hypothetical protein
MISYEDDQEQIFENMKITEDMSIETLSSIFKV